ncbi:GAP family protein [Mycolicibacterium goodii]|uniref:GAP family protein n=1 Tax=Mycolicibacterium goodii TaxID=134601 RepID=UPI000938DFCA|nr:GAP family protein [Mycolicibacterium goodii]MBU8808376.1 GAP family protein [Mycolicibacterium goodii]MBU8829208.1 GAP family protein [Mycolicibacterium goodii]OKH74328.1 integral membrane protein [Mycobacterium sp. SWH-M5]
MWSNVLGMGFFMSLNPMLLGFIPLLLSRPRPVPNLLVFWIGALIVNFPLMLIPLAAMQMIPSFAGLAESLTTAEPGSSVQPFQVGTGVFALLVGVWIAIRMRMKRRARTAEPARVGAASTLVLDDEPAAEQELPQGWIRRAVGKVTSIVNPAVKRARDAWDNGALWVSLLLGFVYMMPPPIALLVDTVIVGADVPVVTQVLAVTAFVLATLLVFEIALLSYVIAPAKTQAILEPLHDWSLKHRMTILLILFIAVGIWQLITGFSLI